ncbi:Ser-type protease [Candidatus Arthromitus sp. SFB-5]|nr:Ser-type protease [Candidatus Arthromitus sp. SFB-5]
MDSAIRVKRNGGDPYTIVPSRDTNGHGTSMAGITSSSGIGLVRGAAPESNIVVVKLRELSSNLREVLDFPKDIPIYNEVVLYLALRYLRSIRFKYNKPVSIVLPLQTNAGYHSGESFVSKQITEYSQNSGFVISVPCGDQANKQIHVEGQIYKENQEGVIEFFADKGQTRLTIDIFIENYSKVSFYVISPSGERTREFDVKGVIYNNYSFKFLLEQTEMKIFCEIRQTSVSIIQDIEILFNNLKSGIWQIIIMSKDNFPVKYDAYLPIKELLKPDTRFLNSTSISTITQPSSAHLAIAMAYYNQNLTSIVTKSGQGFTLDNRVVPLLAAGGIDILTIGKGGREILMSGSSVAAAVSAGGIALILEWGIVKKNKPNLNSTIIMWLFVSSAITPKGYEYPNRYWGYGILNIRNVFDILR